MKLAIWDAPPAEFLISAWTGAGGAPLEVVRARPEACAALLLQDRVDVALLPTLLALQGADGFEFVPGVALSTWAYPYAQLVLKRGLRGPAASVAYDRRAVQERFVARLILREHYGKDPDFVAREAPSVERLLEGEEDAALLVGSDVPALDLPALDLEGDLEDGVALDLGQEWFELAGYPMVWGLLAAKRGTLNPEDVQAFVEAAEAADEQRRAWIRRQQLPAPLSAFFAEDLRLRFDDLATAGLTEYKRYLFYYDVIDDIPSLSFAKGLEEADRKG